jgi:hypothetical protein
MKTTIKTLLAIIFLMVSFQAGAAIKAVHVPNGTTLSGLWTKNYTQSFTQKEFIGTFCQINSKKLVGNCSNKALSRLQNHGKFYYWNLPEEKKHGVVGVKRGIPNTHTLPNGLPGIVVKNIDGKTSIAQLFKTSGYENARKFSQDFCDVQMYGKYGQYKPYRQCIYGWNDLLPQGKWNIPTKKIVFVDNGDHFIVKIETS